MSNVIPFVRKNAKDTKRDTKIITSVDEFLETSGLGPQLASIGPDHEIMQAMLEAADIDERIEILNGSSMSEFAISSCVNQALLGLVPASWQHRFRDYYTMALQDEAIAKHYSKEDYVSAYWHEMGKNPINAWFLEATLAELLSDLD